MAVFTRRKAESENDESWISVSDLMAGLMVIFLFIAITYIRPLQETKKNIKEIAVTWKKAEIDIYEALYKEFEADLVKWTAEIDKETLTVRFNAPKVLFEQNSPLLTEKFKSILSKFFPRYLNVLSKFDNDIEEIRLEGHTSSEWYTDVSPLDAYFKNMSLSQDRTRSVLEYSLNLEGLAKNRTWARDKITAIGLSSSRLIKVNGIENRERSRRVEFRIRTKAREEIVRILEKVQ